MHVCSPTASHLCFCSFQITRLALPVPLFPFGIEGADTLSCCQSPCELRLHGDSAALLNCRNPLVSVLTWSHCLLITAQLYCWFRTVGPAAPLADGQENWEWTTIVSSPPRREGVKGERQWWELLLNTRVGVKSRRPGVLSRERPYSAGHRCSGKQFSG